MTAIVSDNSRPDGDPRPGWKVEPFTWTNHFQLVLGEDLPYSIKHELVKACVTSPHAEICGLITNRDRIVFIPNVHPEPQHNFQMDPVDFRKQIELICAADELPTGCFHSHPTGPPHPSKGDLEGWPDPELNWAYFIVTINGVFRWEKI